LKYAKQAVRDPAGFLATNSDNYIRVNRASSRIKLRLNAKECESKLLLAQIRSLKDLLGKEPESLADSQAEIEPINKKIHASAATVLKSEWKRVKRGEWQYRIAKYAAIAMIILAVLLAVLAFRSARSIGLFG
jgi:hypothetical protein